MRNLLADRCEVQIAYVIGQKEPITRAIETFGSQKVPLPKIEKFAWDLLDLSVPGIIKGLDLLRPIYCQTARYGHFGRDSFPWEKIVV
jgi:S-adenosylmethionine synthetase